jgi:hypothetical protein
MRDDKRRVTAILSSLQKRGIIVREPRRDLQWMPDQVMTFITRALMIDGMRHGTSNWTILTMNALGLSLQKALVCRAGDIAITPRYTWNACLCYKDVRLVAKPIAGANPAVPVLDRTVLVALVTIRYTRNHKAKMVELKSLEGPELNLLDPPKILLAFAARQGAFEHAVTPAEAVERAIARFDQRIQWAYPERPVLCHIEPGDRKMDVTSGASALHLRHTLKHAAALAGFCVKDDGEDSDDDEDDPDEDADGPINNPTLLSLSGNPTVQEAERLDEFLQQTPSEPSNVEALTSAPSVFIKWLSTVNTYVNTAENSHDDDLSVDHLRGGSRAEPTHFVFCCKYMIHGCDFSTDVADDRDRHEEMCGLKKAQKKTVDSKKNLKRKKPVSREKTPGRMGDHDEESGDD